METVLYKYETHTKCPYGFWTWGCVVFAKLHTQEFLANNAKGMVTEYAMFKRK